MAYENGLTHFDKSGQAIMVDVSEKKETSRTAIASGRIRVNRAVYEAIEQGTAKKGDVLGTARIAGIMAAKNTSAVIPLCHPLPIAKCSVDFTMLPEESAVDARATVKVTGQTGVEMEARLTTSILPFHSRCFSRASCLTSFPAMSTLLAFVGFMRALPRRAAPFSLYPGKATRPTRPGGGRG